MTYEFCDRVRIIASGKTGTICDVHTVDGETLYIVDCAGECNSEEIEDCVITVTEKEIERLTERVK